MTRRPLSPKAEARKAARRAADEARAARNRSLRETSDPTAWDLAKLARYRSPDRVAKRARWEKSRKAA